MGRTAYAGMVEETPEAGNIIGVKTAFFVGRRINFDNLSQIKHGGNPRNNNVRKPFEAL
jgi:hypothetical protein